MLRFFMKIIFIAFLWIGSAAAQEEVDPIELHTFPPELVMKHQQGIGLSETQRTAIKKEVIDAQKRFTELEWDLQQKMEAFLSRISQDKVDEQAALAELESVLSLEAQIKQTHLTLLIRIKNILSSEQQSQLRELRK